MAAELRVDTIKSRSGINTFSFTGDNGFTFTTNTGIGTTNATSKLHVEGTALITGVSTFSDDVSIADKIVHTGDTNTAIRFPAADTFTVETAGSERVRVTSTGNIGIGTDNPGTRLEISAPTSAGAISNALSLTQTGTGSGTGTRLLIGYDTTIGTYGSIEGFYDGTGTSLTFGTSDNAGISQVTERLRITSRGDVVLGQGSTVGSSVGVVTYYGDGSNLTGVIAGIDITEAAGLVGAGITNLKFTGSGISTITTDTTVGIATVEIAGGGASEVDTNVSSTSATGVGSFAIAEFRSASVIAQIDQTGDYQVGRYLMIQDGTTVTVLEESAVSTGATMLGSFSGAIVGSNAELQVTMGSAGIATVTTKIDTVTV